MVKDCDLERIHKYLVKGFIPLHVSGRAEQKCKPKDFFPSHKWEVLNIKYAASGDLMQVNLIPAQVYDI